MVTNMCIILSEYSLLYNKSENFNFFFVDLVETQIKELILDIKYPATKKQVCMICECSC